MDERRTSLHRYIAGVQVDLQGNRLSKQQMKYKDTMQGDTVTASLSPVSDGMARSV